MMLDVTHSGNVDAPQILRTIEYYTRLTSHLDDLLYQLSATSTNLNKIYFDGVYAWWYTIKNTMAKADGIKLDGSRKLDGTWKLKVIRAGIDYIKFEAGVFDISSNTESIGMGTVDVIVACTNESQVWFDEMEMEIPLKESTAPNHYQLNGTRKLDGTWKLNGRQRLLNFCEFAVHGSSAQYSESLTVALTIDNRWKLNGAVKLDGSRRFSFINEEEI